MATAKHSVIYSLKADPSDLLQDLKKVGTSFDKLQANFKEGLRARSTVTGPGMMPGAAGGGAGTAAQLAASAGAAAAARSAGTAARSAASAAGKAGLGSMMKGAAMNMLPYLGLTAGAGGLLAMVKGVDQSTEKMETWRRQFKLLGFTAADVNDELENTIDFASATILDTGAVVDARMQLKQLGLDSQRNLTAIADTAQLTGISIGSLADTMGRLKGGNFSQALRPLTKFGISPGSIQERTAALQGEGMAAEEANIKAVIEALEKMAGGTTEELSSTIESLKGTLGNEWMKASAELGKAFEPAQKALLEAGVMMAGAMKPLARLVEGGNWVANQLGEMGSFYADWITGDTNKVIQDAAKMGMAAPPGFSRIGPVGLDFYEGLGSRSKTVLEGIRSGLGTVPAGLNLPELPPEPAPKPLSEYEAVTQARNVNNFMNYTIYSPVGIAPNVNLAGLASR